MRTPYRPGLLSLGLVLRYNHLHISLKRSYYSDKRDKIRKEDTSLIEIEGLGNF